MQHPLAMWGTVFVLALCAMTAAQAQASPPGPPAWADEFDGDGLDPAKWRHRASGERHDGILTPDAVSVRDGVLTIATYTEDGRNLSGMISTQPRDGAGFEQRYGYFEARMKFNSSPGQWSAFWLQSTEIGKPVGDPAAAGVEMDIAEHRARCGRSSAAQDECPAGEQDISDRVQQALIWDGYGDERQARVRLTDPLPRLGAGGWHTYALRWTPTRITFLYDDAETWSVSAPVSRRAQYIVLSSEVGEFFAGTIPAAGYGTREASTTDMQVDYVRVWETGAGIPVSTGAPAVSGAARVGATLSCSTGSWSSEQQPALTYQWLSDGRPLDGASAPTQVVRGSDRGHALACRVTASNSAGVSSALSNAIMIPHAAQRLAPTVAVTIDCAICTARVVRAAAFGSVRVPRGAGAPATTYRPAATASRSADGKAVRIALRLARGVRAAITRALRAGRRIVVTLGVRIVDSAGKRGTIVRRIPLKL